MARSFGKQLRDNQGLLVLIVASVLLLVVLSVQYWYTRNNLESQAREMAQTRLDNTHILLEAEMSSIEVVVENLSRVVQDNLQEPEAMYRLTRLAVESVLTLSECGILFVPDYYGSRASHAFHPATYRAADGTFETSDHNEKNFNYYERQWYKEVVESGSPVWTDPYSSRTDQALVSTFSMPIRDAAGAIVGVIYADVSVKWLADVAKEGTAVYKNSFSLFLNGQGTPIVFDDEVFQELESAEDLYAAMRGGKSGERRIRMAKGNGFAFFSPIGNYGWSMAIVCPEKDMFLGYDRMSSIIFFFSLLVFLIMAFILMRSARDLTKLKKVEATKQRIEGELSVAHNIQMGMIPKVFPPFPERDDIDIYATLVAAKEVGGDLYDFFISDNVLWFCIGDVSGKGVPASLLMAVTRSLFRTNAMQYDSPATVMAAINDATAEMNENNMFVTAFVGRLDLRTGELEYCNAGHNTPVICSGAGPRFIEMACNLPVGVLQGFAYTEEKMTLARGECFFLYTDGVTEAENVRKELFGEERMLAVLKTPGTPQEIVQNVTRAVHAHANGAEQSDDITMLAILYRGPVTR